MTNTSFSPVVCHFLIGAPGSGKSTLAEQWAARSQHHVVISTDQVRAKLYGNADIQGNWPEIEAEVVRAIQIAIADGKSVIYDATNVRRGWRMGLLRKLADGKTHWMGWWLQTDLATCKARNQQRDRQVSEAVIEASHRWLKQFKPSVAEGFAAENPVPMLGDEFDFASMEQKVRSLPRTIQNRRNKAAQKTLHRYADLLSFERLMYLIALLVKYPGAGGLQATQPQVLKQVLQVETIPEFERPEAEIAALMAREYGAIYADEAAIAVDLAWLEQNGLLNANPNQLQQPLVIPPLMEPCEFDLHRYSDVDTFERLISMLRLILHYPFMQDPNRKADETLVELLSEHGIYGFGKDSLRRDISEVLKPYGIMEQTTMSKGYFAGTAILSRAELLQVYTCLEGQATRLDDPISLAAYELFQDRMRFLQLEPDGVYPVRTVINQPIVASQFLPEHSLALPSQGAILEEAIRSGERLRLRRLRGTGRFAADQDEPFEAIPLQIVFYNIAWYLGYVRQSDSLLQFERLDRLAAEKTGFICDRGYQDRARDQLHVLQQAGFSPYLGKSAAEQQQFLSGEPEVRSRVEEELELWFTDEIFRFISEGTQRFANVRMSPRLGISMSEAEKQQVFTLKKTDDWVFPNRLRARLPIWVLRDDLELRSWILRFGGGVKVVAPGELAKRIQQMGREIFRVYYQEEKKK